MKPVAEEVQYLNLSAISSSSKNTKALKASTAQPFIGETSPERNQTVNANTSTGYAGTQASTGLTRAEYRKVTSTAYGQPDASILEATSTSSSGNTQPNADKSINATAKICFYS